MAAVATGRPQLRGTEVAGDVVVATGGIVALGYQNIIGHKHFRY
jgi:hypothetical protein